MTMRHTLLLLILALTLSGCFVAADPASGISINGPDSAAALQARADSARQEAQRLEADAKAAAANEAARAQAAQNVRALAATATAQALNVARAQLDMTAQAMNFPSTQAAVAAQQTLQALEAKATVDAQAMRMLQEQAQTTATSQALIAQQAVEANQAQATVDAGALVAAQQQSQATAAAQTLQRDNLTAAQVADNSQQGRELGAWLIPVLAVIAFGVVVLLGTKFVSGLIDRANDGRRLENERLAQNAALLAAPTENIFFIGDPQTAFAKLQLLNKPKNIDIDDTGNVWMSPADVIDADEAPLAAVSSSVEMELPDQAEARAETARYKVALKLVRDAIDHEGAHSNRIPSAEQLGWPDAEWTIAVATLRPYGVEILHEQERETYLVGPSGNLQNLYIAVGEKYSTYFPAEAENVMKSSNLSPGDLAASTSG
jgi:chemotaxis protein histidine kinase CheA